MATAIKDNFIKRLKCPVCYSENFKQEYQIAYHDEIMKNYLDSFYNLQGGVEHNYLKNATYSLKTCLKCNLIFQEYIPNNALMFKLYEEWINTDIVCKEQEEYPLWYHENYSKQIVNLVTYFNKTPNNLCFLDYGMGWGKWCLMAKAFGCNAYGLELSKSRIVYAENNGIKVLNEKELLNCKFDYINTDQVFEHIPDPLKVLQGLTKRLKPNGIIKISVPNGNIIEHVLDKMDWTAPKGHVNSVNAVAPLEHINCFKTKTIEILTKECGLIQVEIPEVRQHYRSKKHFIKKMLKLKKNMKTASITLFFKLQ